MIYPWQEHIWQQFCKMANAQRIPHAILLTGMRGVGKLHLAEQFARALLCQSASPFSTECGTCHACRLFIGRSHPNMLWIEPEKAGQAIKVDQIREVTHFLNESALQGEHRIVIIHPASNMNLNAANALLKTLEEPTPGAILILIGDQSDRLPATILSRCQRIVFHRPDETLALTWLKKTLTHDADNAALYLRLANGAPLIANIFSEEETLPMRKQLLQAYYQVQGNESPLKLAANLDDIEPLAFIDFLLSLIMDVLKLQLNSNMIINEDYRIELNDIKQKTNLKLNEKFLQYLQTLRKEICSGINFNKQLLIESTLIRWLACQRT